jgi:glutaminyl-tRNA synthetase
VSAADSISAEVRLYSHLFNTEDPMDVAPDEEITANLNPDSLETLRDCRVEPSVAAAVPGASLQFERLGYFCADPDSSEAVPVFNRTVTLRDTWAKIAKKGGR